MINWDPQAYLQAADQRARPFLDLTARIGAPSPRAVVDLGCGPGNLTALLAARWPQAQLRAIDSSPDMVAAARDHGVDAELGDVAHWSPGPDDDVVVCNAVLHWVPGHLDLLRGWATQLAAGSWFAFQVPGNFAAPSHVLARALAARPSWRSRLQGALLDEQAVHEPAEYAAVLAATGCDVDVWETTYLHRMRGADPVLNWLVGTALRPVRTALGQAQWAQFTAELAPRLRSAYPAAADGATWYPFRRILAVATRP